MNLNAFRSLSFIIAGLTAVAVAGCGSDPAPAAAADAADAAVDAAADVADTQADDTGPAAADTAAAKPDAKADVKKDTKADPNTLDNTIDGAVPLDPAAATSDQLDPTGDVDFYSFEGKKGDIFTIGIVSQLAQTTQFDPASIDSVITVYGPDKQPYAFNDDPAIRNTNDSQILTILPKDGTYYVKVEECSTWLADNPKGGASCASPIDKTNVDYQIYIDKMDLVKSTSQVFDKEPNDKPAEAQAVAYGTNKAGKYYLSQMLGFFASATDVDVYKFSAPQDNKDDKTRLSANFDSDNGGVDGNGSTAQLGLLWIASEATPTAIIAQADFATQGLNVPLKFGKTYYLYVVRADGPVGAWDFYSLTHSWGGGNPIELMDLANDTTVGSETLTAAKSAAGLAQYFVEGDLINQAKDVDIFNFAPAGKTMSVTCGALYSGSGLRDLTVEVLGEDGKVIASGIETEKKLANVDKFAVPQGAFKLYIRVTATQDAKVLSSFYRCGVHEDAAK